MGDVHGHRDVLVRLLGDVGLLDAGEAWTGADARLWLLGDLTDRGPDGIGTIDLVRRLERESGGATNAMRRAHPSATPKKPPGESLVASQPYARIERLTSPALSSV